MTDNSNDKMNLVGKLRFRFRKKYYGCLAICYIGRRGEKRATDCCTMLLNSLHSGKLLLVLSENMKFIPYGH